MLVKFDSKVGTLTMFGEVAVQLLQMMGHSGTIPSALLAADIPPAIDRLERALAGVTPPPPPPPTPGDESDQPGPVSLRLRAFPLIELLKRASAKEVDVMWDRQ
jgi:hypothetical protein